MCLINTTPYEISLLISHYNGTGCKFRPAQIFGLSFASQGGKI